MTDTPCATKSEKETFVATTHWERRETWLSTNKESEIFSDLVWNAVQRTAPDDGREDRYREGDIGI